MLNPISLSSVKKPPLIMGVLTVCVMEYFHMTEARLEEFTSGQRNYSKFHVYYIKY